MPLEPKDVPQGVNEMSKCQLNLFADYFQFCLQDEHAEGNFSDSWNEQTVRDGLAVVPNAFAVRTARNTTVPVVVEVRDSAPQDDDFDEWDRINECSLDVPSGRIVVAGCTDYFPTAARIAVEPGSYRARIYYGGLDTITGNGLQSNDHYRVVSWLAEYSEAQVFKSHLRGKQQFQSEDLQARHGRQSHTPQRHARLTAQSAG